MAGQADAVIDDLFGAPIGKPPPPQAGPTEADFVVDSLFGEAPTTGEANRAKTSRQRADDRIRGVLMKEFGTDQLGDKELSDLGARFKLGLADKPSDQKAIFNKMFPEGELLVIPGDDTFDQEVLFRKNPESPFARLDDDGFMGSFGADLAEFIANDIGAITGEGAALAIPQLFPQGRAVGLIGKGLQMMARNPLKSAAGGAALGEIAQEGVEQIAGLAADTSLREVGEQAAGQAVASFVGGFLVDKGGRMIFNLVSGRGLGRRKAGAERVLRAQKELGLPTIPADMMLQNQLIGRMAGQARAQTSAGPIRLEELQMGVSEVMQDLAAQNRRLIDIADDGTVRVRALPDVGTLEKMAIREQREIQKTLEGRLRLWKRTQAQAGANVQGAVLKFRAKLPKEVRDALERGGPAEVGRVARLLSVDEMGKIARWDIRARGRISLAYAKAQSIESPDFDITGLHNVALEIDGAIGGSLDPTLKPLQELKEEILKMPAKIEPKLMSRVVGDEINLWSVDATTQLRMLRSRASDIAHSGVPGADAEAVQALAKRLGGAITETLTKPTNSSPTFLKAWQRANKLARKKFAIEERFTFMTEAVASTDMKSLGKRLSNMSDTGNVEVYKGLRSIMTRKEFNNFRDSITTEMVREPFQLSKKLADAEPDVLRSVFNSNELSMMRQTAKKFDALAEADIQKVLRTQLQLPLIARDLVNQNNSAATAQLVSMVKKSGGPDSPVGRLVRAGYLEHLFGIGEIVGDFPMRGVAVEFKGGIVQVKKAVLDEELRKLNEMGALALFTDTEIRQMSNAVVISDVLQKWSDAGTSIAGAETASQIRGTFFGSGGGAGGIKTLFENIAIGQLLISKAGQKMISGSSTKEAINTPLRRLILMGGIAGQLATDAKAVGEKAGALVEWGVRATGRVTDAVIGLGREGP